MATSGVEVKWKQISGVGYKWRQIRPKSRSGKKVVRGEMINNSDTCEMNQSGRVQSRSGPELVPELVPWEDRM